MKKVILAAILLSSALAAPAAQAGGVSVVTTPNYNNQAITAPGIMLTQTNVPNITVQATAKIENFDNINNAARNDPAHDMHNLASMEKAAAANMGINSLVPASGKIDVSKYMNMEGVDDADATQFVPAE